MRRKVKKCKFLTFLFLFIFLNHWLGMLPMDCLFFFFFFVVCQSYQKAVGSGGNTLCFLIGRFY